MEADRNILARLARGVLAVAEGGVAVVVAILLAFALLLVFSSLAGPGAGEALPGDPWRPGRVVVVILAQSTSFATVALALRRLRVRKPAPLASGRRSPTAGRLALAGVGVGVAAVIVSHGIETLQAWLGHPVREQEWIVALVREGGIELLATLPLIVLVGPAAEELFFRGYLFSFLEERSGVFFGAAVSGLYFAVVHFNPSGLSSYLFLGLLFAWALHRWGSVLVPAIAHAINNLAAVGLLFVQG